LEAGVEQGRHVEGATVEALDDLAGNRLCICEGDVLDPAGVVLVNDLLWEEAADDGAALAADQVEIDRLALTGEFVGMLARGADDVRVERSG
jgi:hypothetical protein